MTFLCISTFLSLVFQQDAQSLLGEKRTEYLLCSTSAKWSPEPLTSTPLETELNVTKECLISWGKLNRGWSQVHIWQLPFKLPRDLFSPASSDSLHSAELPTGQCHPLLRHLQACRGRKILNPEGMSQSRQDQTLHGQDWGKDTLVHQCTGADSCTKFRFHYHTTRSASLKCSFPKNNFPKPL